jgi:enoyl-CoA hydratase/carnithine racemase
MSSIVLESFADGVQTLSLNRPERRNAFNNELYLDLARAIEAAAAAPAVRVVLLRGEGATFSSGQDMTEMRLPDSSDEIGFMRFIGALAGYTKPVVAAVQGAAIGVGATLLLHADIVLMAHGARMRFPFTTLGVVPEAGSSVLLPERVGAQAAAELLFTGRWVDAEECVRLGLALRAVPAEELDAAAAALATEIAARPPASVRQTKALLRAPQQGALDAAIARENQCFIERLGSPENLEAIQAFFEKRAPRFDDLA